MRVVVTERSESHFLPVALGDPRGVGETLVMGGVVLAMSGYLVPFASSRGTMTRLNSRPFPRCYVPI